MRSLFRSAVSTLFIVAASNASAGVITQDGVVFTSTYVGNVLTLEIDAAKRSGGWAGASAIDALALKTIGGFSGVSMSAPAGAAWSLVQSELNARGCAAAKGKAGATDMTRLCYTGAGITLADNMVFTFTFTGAPALSAPHLKVHFVDARGSKVGSLLSLDFPWQAASIPVSGSNQTLPASAADEDASEVPEPRTLGLMTAGLITLAVARRQRRK
jgi:hypothetical protein